MLRPSSRRWAALAEFDVDLQTGARYVLITVNEFGYLTLEHRGQVMAGKATGGPSPVSPSTDSRSKSA